MARLEDYYRMLFEHVGVGIAVVEEDGTISTVNRVFEKASGYSRADIEGCVHYMDLFPDCSHDPVAELRHLRKDDSSSPVHYEAKLRRKDGGELDVYLSVGAAPGTSEAVMALLDITEWVRMRQKLFHAEKLSVMGQLVSGVAHELNNPLTAIQGFAQLTQGKGSDPTTNADLRLLWLQSQRASRIVQNLLSIARRRDPEPSFVDVNEIIESAIELVDYRLQVDDIIVRREFDRDLPWTMADPYQIQQVILNLVNNAHHAMVQSAGRGVLTLRTALVPGDRDTGDSRTEFIRIEVQDTGPGFGPAVLAHLFEPFFTTKAVGEGTGLGLAICHGIVESHDGRIGVVSPPQGEEQGPSTGTTLFVELPVIERPEGVVEEAPVLATAGKQTSPLRILIVEDEEAIRLLLARVFGEEGHEVVTARDGQEALGHLRKREFDVVIADLKMPRMSGQELYWHMEREWPELAQHTLLITGDVINPATRHFLARVTNPVLKKPLAIDDIRRVLLELASSGAGEEDA